MPPKKRSYTKKSFEDSYRVKLGESTHHYPIAQLRAMLMEAADGIEAAGITHVRPCNLYISPADDQGNPVTRVGGQPLKDITIPGPYRSAADEHGV